MEIFQNSQLIGSATSDVARQKNKGVWSDTLLAITVAAAGLTGHWLYIDTIGEMTKRKIICKIELWNVDYLANIQSLSDWATLLPFVKNDQGQIEMGRGNAKPSSPPKVEQQERIFLNTTTHLL